MKPLSFQTGTGDQERSVIGLGEQSHIASEPGLLCSLPLACLIKGRNTNLSEVPGTKLKNNVCTFLLLQVLFIFFSQRFISSHFHLYQ